MSASQGWNLDQIARMVSCGVDAAPVSQMRPAGEAWPPVRATKCNGGKAQDARCGGDDVEQSQREVGSERNKEKGDEPAAATITSSCIGLHKPTLLTMFEVSATLAIPTLTCSRARQVISGPLFPRVRPQVMAESQTLVKPKRWWVLVPSSWFRVVWGYSLLVVSTADVLRCTMSIAFCQAPYYAIDLCAHARPR